jgi:large conductance mechanosensitive channel
MYPRLVNPRRGYAVVKEFKEFLLRGNLVELAVAFVIGLAFAAVVTSLVEDLVTPLVAAIFGRPDFAGLTFTVNESTFRYGEFLNALVAFGLVAAVLFFFVVKPVNALVERRTRQCPECRSEIPADARRCAFCATEVAASA